jgi:hypothetical protein
MRSQLVPKSFFLQKCCNCNLLMKKAQPIRENKMIKYYRVTCPHYNSICPKIDEKDREELNPVFFTRWFELHVLPDYRTIMVTAKDGYKLAVDPSQTNEEKIVVTSLRKG